MRIRRRDQPTVIQRHGRGDANWLDIWLKRGSHIAQFGLFTATIFGFYYTVIPLYQKAALDEQIAQRSVELRKAEMALRIAEDKAYAYERLNFQRGLAFSASDKCTAFRQFISVDGHSRDPFANMKIKLKECLTEQMAARAPAKVLRPADADFMRATLEKLGTTLDAKKTQIQKRIEAVPRLAETNPEQLDPPGEFLKRAYDFQDQAAIALAQPLSAAVKNKRLMRAVEDTQHNLARAFQQHSMDEIRKSVMQATWPVSVPVPPDSSTIVPR